MRSLNGGGGGGWVVWYGIVVMGNTKSVNF
jgi:hypothetical protein